MSIEVKEILCVQSKGSIKYNAFYELKMLNTFLCFSPQFLTFSIQKI